MAVLFIWNFFNEHWWDDMGVMVWDTAAYYGYLPKAFNPPTDKLSPEEVRIKGLAPINKYVIAPNGNKLLKTTMGMAVLYSPFYAVGHIAHYIIHGSPGSGFELEYRMAMQFCGLFYLLAGLLLLHSLMKPFFKEGIIALSFIVLVFGTNAAYYTAYEGCMTHIPNFFLVILFLFCTVRWYKCPSLKISIAIGLLAGLITLIRPTNVLVGLIFLLYDITSLQKLKERAVYLATQLKFLLLMGLLVVAVWVPQLMYWHNMTGQYLFYSYVGESFYFSHPRILLGLFSWRKGWLIYTPVGWLVLSGFIFLKRYVAKMQLFIFVWYAAMVYVIFSWWCWWYGGSFSCRPMVDTYGVLVFPLASLLSYVYTTGWPAIKKTVFSLVLVLLVSLNLFQTYQYKKQVIHWEQMSFAAYKQVFLSLEPPTDSLLNPVPFRAAINGEYAK
jgi:hypothetical protein